MKYLKKENVIVVSYSDTAMNHHGYIYQACNFLYTGCTKERTDKCIGLNNNTHPRHCNSENESNEYRKVRSAKYRYVYFCTSNKKLKKNWMDSLRYNVMPYPKGDNNPDYELGNYIVESYVIKEKD